MPRLAALFHTTAVNFFILLIGFLNSIVLARILNPSGRGEVAAAMLWPGLLVYLGSLGLTPATLYYAAKVENNISTIVSNTFILALAQSLLVMVIGYWAMPQLLSSQSELVIVGSRFFLWSITPALISQYALAILQAKLHLGIFNSIRLISPIGYFLGVGLLAFFQQLDLLNILRLQLGLQIFVAIGSVVALFRWCEVRSFRPQVNQAKEMLQYGLKVQFGTVSQLANLRLDQTLISAFMPPAQLGLYVTAVSAASLAQVLSTAVRLVITPAIAQTDGLANQIHVLLKSFRAYWLFSLLNIVALALVLPIVIPLIFGPEFQEAIWPAEIIIFATLFLGAKEVLSGAIQAFGNPWLVSQSEIVALAVTILFLVILLPLWGILGAAITTLLAYFISLIVLVYGLQRLYAIPPLTIFPIRYSELKNGFKEIFSLIQNFRKLI